MNRALAKQHAKQLVRRTIGEPYVGKRLKLRRLNYMLPTLRLQPSCILDAGAEDATFVYWLADLYPDATITAVDIDADGTAACRAARPPSYAVSIPVTELCARLDRRSPWVDGNTVFARAVRPTTVAA